MRFREALISAAQQAAADGDITQQDVMRIRLATLRPRIVRQMEEECCEQLKSTHAMGANAAPGAIDWTAFLDFIKQLIQMILQMFT